MMENIKFSDCDSSEKQAMFWLSDQAETLTPYITAAASCIGEIWEAVNFMREYPKGSEPHMILAERLRLGSGSDESILACIARAAPTYRTLSEQADAELDELLYGLRSAATAF